MFHALSLYSRAATFFLCLAICGFATSVSAQNKKVIFLKNKNASPFSLDNPETYLSIRAIERRKRFNIPIDSSDLPVNPSYTSQISSLENVRVIGKSKWMNAVIIECNNTNTMSQISNLPFVKAVSNIALRKKEKTKIKTEPVRPSGIIAGRQLNIGTNRYNYGSSYNQIALHNGQLLHNIGAAGQNMMIAFFDSGFRDFYANRFMDSALQNNQFFLTKDIVNNNTEVNNGDAHGLYCLSTVAANIPGEYVGSCPKASYLLLRTEDVASEQIIEEYYWALGAEYADSCGADVFTSSVGYTTFDDPEQDHRYSDLDGNKVIVTIAADKAASKGIFVVTSAGNEGGSSWKYIGTPADGDSVYAVGAVDIQKNIAGFSSFGPTYDGRIKPDGLSVGLNTYLISTGGSLITANGTSFSTPNLAGLITCLWQLFPDINNADLLKIIRASSDRYNNPLPQYGYGIPDMSKAIEIILKKNTEFTSSITDCKPTLSWKSHDYKGMGYMIQRKFFNESEFTSIDTILCTGTTWEKRAYSYTDYPISKNSKYRIIQLLDTSKANPLFFILDSTEFNLSESCRISDITLYPNPAKAFFKIKIATPAVVNNIQIEVYSISGQRIKAMAIQKPAGLYITPEISTAGMQKGMYMIKIKYNNQVLLQEKLLIQ